MSRFVSAACVGCLVCLMGLGKDAPKASGGAAQLKSIAFDEFMDTFTTNEARAEVRYQGKQITVTGKVARVITNRHPPSKDGTDVYVVELKAGESGLSTVSVQFYFSKTERAQLADLRAGQEVTIQGRCERRAIYTGDRQAKKKDYVEVPVRECTILKAK